MAFPRPLQSLWGNKKAHERPSWAACCGVTGSEQMCRHQEVAVLVVSNPGYCSPHLLGQSPVCLIRAAALHSTGTTPINSTVLLPGSWCFHKGLRELLGAGASWPITQTKTLSSKKAQNYFRRWFSLTAEHNLPASCSHCSRAVCKLSGVSAATGTSSKKTRKLLCFWMVFGGSKGGLNVILWQHCHVP